MSQMKGAWVLVGVGVVMLAGGVIVEVLRKSGSLTLPFPPDFLKLALFLVGGVIMMFGFFKRAKIVREGVSTSSYSSDSSTAHSDLKSQISGASGGSSSSFGNSELKNYILQYKGSYPRDAIKSTLQNSGYDLGEIESYLKEFYDK